MFARNDDTTSKFKDNGNKMVLARKANNYLERDGNRTVTQ